MQETFEEGAMEGRDPHAMMAEMRKTKKEEVDGIFDKGTRILNLLCPPDKVCSMAPSL